MESSYSFSCEELLPSCADYWQGNHPPQVNSTHILAQPNRSTVPVGGCSQAGEWEEILKNTEEVGKLNFDERQMVGTEAIVLTNFKEKDKLNYFRTT